MDTDALKSIGCDTAKSVLELSVEELAKRTDLEEETIKEVKSILQKEFEVKTEIKAVAIIYIWQ